MASTLTLQNSINWASAIIKNQPQMVNNQEPALTAGNIILGTMLGPPMRWRFNRATFNFGVTTAGGTDYQVTLGQLGFIEHFWIVQTSNSQIHEVSGQVTLPPNPVQRRPDKIAPQYDNNAGTITFRLNSTPDQAYTVYGDYQQKATLMTSAASPWGSVPDEFEYIFNQGFLSLMMLLINDSRFPIFENYFIARLLGSQDGLDIQQTNIFVGNWMALVQTLSRSQGQVNAGVAGRGK